MYALRVLRPGSIEEATHLLGESSCLTKVVGGGTWMMRNSDPAEVLLDISGIEGLRTVDCNSDLVRIGASVTHSNLGRALEGQERLSGLRVAAQKSANPHVRHRATVGGNLATTEFAPADLVPILLAMDAEVEVANTAGQRRQSLETWVPAQDELVVGVQCTPWFTASGHARLTMRAAGDYPVAIVSIAAALDNVGMAKRVQIAVGALSARAERWLPLEAELTGRRLDPYGSHVSAERLVDALPSHGGVGVPPWYRRAVIPSLVQEAVRAMLVRSTS